jgi:hypothetical protein
LRQAQPQTRFANPLPESYACCLGHALDARSAYPTRLYNLLTNQGPGPICWLARLSTNVYDDRNRLLRRPLQFLWITAETHKTMRSNLDGVRSRPVLVTQTMGASCAQRYR